MIGLCNWIWAVCEDCWKNSPLSWSFAEFGILSSLMTDFVWSGGSRLCSLLGLMELGGKESESEWLGVDDSLPQIKNPICRHYHWRPDNHSQTCRRPFHHQLSICGFWCMMRHRSPVGKISYKGVCHPCSLGTSFDWNKRPWWSFRQAWPSIFCDFYHHQWLGLFLSRFFLSLGLFLFLDLLHHLPVSVIR